jgi:hypothetical protein
MADDWPISTLHANDVKGRQEPLSRHDPYNLPNRNSQLKDLAELPPLATMLPALTDYESNCEANFLEPVARAAPGV